MSARPLPHTERERRARAQAEVLARMRLIAWRDAVAGVEAPDAGGLCEALRRLRLDAVPEPADGEGAGRKAFARFALGGRAATADEAAPAGPAPVRDDSLARLGEAAADAAMRRDPVMAQAFAQIRLGAWAQARDAAAAPGLGARLQSLDLGLAPDLASTPTLALERAAAFATTRARRVRRGVREGDSPLLWATPVAAVAPAAPPEEDVAQGRLAASGADFAPFGADRFVTFARSCIRSADPKRAERLAYVALELWSGTLSRRGRPDLATALAALRIGQPDKAPSLQLLQTGAPPHPSAAHSADPTSSDWRHEQAELMGRVGGDDVWNRISSEDLLLDAEPSTAHPSGSLAFDQLDAGATWRATLSSLVERVGGPAFWKSMPRDVLAPTKTSATPKPAPRRAGRAERLMPDAQALGFVESIRRARRYGDADALITIVSERGAALAAHPLTRETYAQLTQAQAEQAVPADAGYADGPVARVAEAFMVAIGAPSCWARVARRFPYAQAGLAANDPFAQGRSWALGLSARRRAQRSFAWFMSGAPELAAGDVSVDGSDLARPRLTLDGATLTLSPDMTDSADPALVWLVMLAMRCAAVARPAAGFDERRAYRDAFMATFARWIALAEMIRRADSPAAARAVAGPGWFTTALSARQADTAQTAPIVLELSARSLGLDGAGLRHAKFNLATRRFVDAQDRGLCLDEAIDGAALVVTDEASAALSCALRGKITLLVANDRAALRAPSVEGLTRVAPEEISAAISARLAQGADIRR